MKVKAKESFISPWLGEVIEGKEYEVKELIAKHYISTGKMAKTKQNNSGKLVDGAQVNSTHKK